MSLPHSDAHGVGKDVALLLFFTGSSERGVLHPLVLQSALQQHLVDVIQQGDRLGGKLCEIVIVHFNLLCRFFQSSIVAFTIQGWDVVW